MNIVSIIKSYLDRRKYRSSLFRRKGRNVIIGPNCSLVPRNMDIGDNVIIQDNVKFISYKGQLVIKKYSVISSSCIIVPSYHRIAVGMPFYHSTITHVGDEDHTIVINEDVWIGAGVIMLPKCEIGRGCIIGAGSVVTKKIPPYAVAIGNPAKIHGVKMGKEQIIEHEKMIYPKEDRLTEQDVDSLFEKHYKDVPILPCYKPNPSEMDMIDKFNHRL